MKLELRPVELELKVTWKISRNKSHFKRNFLIYIDGYPHGEIAPNIRYGEDEKVITDDFKRFVTKCSDSLDQNLSELSKEGCNAFRFGMESALIHYECIKKSMTLNDFLKITQSKAVLSSFSIPIMEPEEIKLYLDNKKYPILKLKINQENPAQLVHEVFQHFDGKLRVDANEAFTEIESFLSFQEEIKNYSIEFIEQPFRAQDTHLYQELYPQSIFPIMADESIEHEADMHKLSTHFHMVNIKLMKAGGYLNAIRLMQDAKKHGLKVMLGCMIETSLGIASALELSSLADYFDLDGSLLISNDPFNFINDKDGILSLKAPLNELLEKER